MDISEIKAALRSEIRAKRRALTDSERTDSSGKVAERLLDIPEIAKAECVLAYMPMKFELDILPAVRRLREMGKRIAYPLCIENGGLRLFVPPEKDGFKTGMYGILEPNAETSEEIDPNDLDAIILPAIGFDRELNRLGQGGGYYDRLLTKTDCFNVAVGFDCQLVDKVPVEETDRRIDAAVTPGETVRHFS